MSEERPLTERLASIAARSPRDPVRRAFESTPQGRAELAAFLAFMSTGEPPAGARPDEAEARLSAALAQAIHGPGAAAEQAAPLPATRPSAATAPARLRPAPSIWARLFGALGAATLRPVYAAAALALVVGALWVGAHRPGSTEPPLRGHVTGGTGQTPERLVLGEPVTPAGGALTLSWSAEPGADHYEVRFYAADLSPLGAPLRVDATHVALDADHRPAPPAGGGALLYRVTAFQGVDPVAVSPIATLPRP